MAGYSATPLPKKLGIKQGHVVALIESPRGFDAVLGALPDGARVQNGARSAGPFDVVVLFAKSRTVLEKHFDRVAAKLDPAGALWVAWPKKASGVLTDLGENDVRTLALTRGLVDNKVCAIDDTWSGLRCVYRLKDRPRLRSSR
jgi:hypothetical protein